VQKCLLFEISHFFLSFMGLNKIFRWNLDHFQIEFLCFLWDKWTILRLFLLKRAHCKNEYFLRYCTDLLRDLVNFSRLNSDYFQIKFLQFLWGKWIILILFYRGVYYVKMCIFWDIALIYVCIVLSQFLEVKSRPHLHRIFMFFRFVFLF